MNEMTRILFIGVIYSSYCFDYHCNIFDFKKALNKMHPRNTLKHSITAARNTIASILFLSSMALPVSAEMRFVDLTHDIPTFRPQANNGLKPDLSKPVDNSKAIAGFGPQAILYPADLWPTSDGVFHSASFLIQEHNGTSFNSPNHYVNNVESTEKGAIPEEKRKAAHQLTTQQLTGKIVFIDVSKRVQKELDKNGGRPSPDQSITDFSDTSQATVRAKDIDLIEDQIEDGVWLVAHVGWDKFYGDNDEDWEKSTYVNNLNHPGFSREATDRLIQIMEKKNVKISGIAANSFSTDSGASAKGTDDKWSNAWPAHVRLYQRDILIVENLNNLDKLAEMLRENNECALMVGALKHVGGTGGPARVMAVCNR